MAHKPKILFIHSGASSFVNEDIRILSNISEINTFHFKASKSIFSLIKNFLIQFFWLLKNISSADLIYIWFSDYHAFLPVVFSKVFKIPSITVLGGFDCNKFESLNYGIFCSSWRAPLGKFVLQNSSLLLPVDETLIKTTAVAKHWGEAHPNGVSHNIPNFQNTWKAVATGYDSNIWKPGPIDRPKIVTTIAFCSNHRTALIKGWDLFIETSKLLPDYEFNIVGASSQFAEILAKKYQPGDNLKFIPPQPRDKLEKIYHQTSVYVQLSRAEGLPNVLCEAMMCGCIPVGSPVFGIPHGIGDAGFIIKKPEAKTIATAIKQAHTKSSQLRTQARQRITEEFSLEKRAAKLQDIIYSNVE